MLHSTAKIIKTEIIFLTFDDSSMYLLVLAILHSLLVVAISHLLLVLAILHLLLVLAILH